MIDKTLTEEERIEQLIQLVELLLCEKLGHNMVEEIIDAESGAGSVYCTRCGYEHSYYI